MISGGMERDQRRQNWLMGESNIGKNSLAKFRTSKWETVILNTSNKKHLSDLLLNDVITCSTE